MFILENKIIRLKLGIFSRSGYVWKAVLANGRRAGLLRLTGYRILLAAGGAALICGGAIMSYLKTQTPMSAQDELTLANLEAMAVFPPGKIDLDDDLDEEAGRIDCYGVLTNAGYGHITVTKCSTCLDETCRDYTDQSKCRK